MVQPQPGRHLLLAGLPFCREGQAGKKAHAGGGVKLQVVAESEIKNRGRYTGGACPMMMAVVIIDGG